LLLRLFAILFVGSLCACGGGGGGSSTTPTVPVTPAPTVKPSAKPTVAPTAVPTATPTPGPAPAGRIQHVVVIIQENRSLDNLFQGFPNADTQNYGMLQQPGFPPTKVPLQMVPLAVPCDISHAHLAWATDWDGGKMDGFGLEPFNCLDAATPPPVTYPYSYVNPNDVAPYWLLARNYVLMDEVFEDPTSPSFQSHQFLIAGQSYNTSENPQYNGAEAAIWGCDAPAGTTIAVYDGLGDTQTSMAPCFPPPYATVADLLDAKGLKWKYYAPSIGAAGDIWSAFDAVQSVRYGPDWSNVISPETSVLSQANTLPSVTFVVPSFANSDHASSNSNTGPAWVASVVNAIGQSPNWSSTAIILLWDDWGGWYDHVAPAVSANYQIGGFRVPVICISPYSEQANPASPVVDHRQHGTTAILSFIEEAFGLGSLNAQDAKELPLNDCFNFNSAPKPFTAVQASALYPPSYFMRARPSNMVPDDDR